MGFACSKPCHCWDEGSGSRPIPLEVIGVGGHPTAFSCFLRTPLSEDARPSCQPCKQVCQLRWDEGFGSRPSPLEVLKGVAIPLPPVASSEYLSVREPSCQPCKQLRQVSWRHGLIVKCAHQLQILSSLVLCGSRMQGQKEQQAGEVSDSRTREAASLCIISFAARQMGSGTPDVESCASASHCFDAVNCAPRASLIQPRRPA